MGSEIQLETRDDDVWNILAKVIFPGDTSSITFDVKACHDARIGLESVTGSGGYEVVIGGHINERNYIRRSNVPPDNEVDDRAHPGLLSCFEFRTFWISWQGGEVRVGHGYDVNDISSVFVLWTDPSPFDVDIMGIRTGFGSTGTWIFNKIYQTGGIENNAGNAILTTAFSYHFCTTIGQYTSDDIITMTNSGDNMECAMLCSRQYNCNGFNYESSWHRCKLLQTADSSIINFVKWKFYRKCIL